MPQPTPAALRLTRKKRKNSPIVCTQNYSLRGEKGSLLSALGSGRFAHELGDQLLAAAKPLASNKNE